MDDAFELLDPQDAQHFLKRLPPEARRKGEASFRAGRVDDLVSQEPGARYSAVVNDSRRHTVYLYFDPEDGWDGKCSCPAEFDCEHVFAAMSALLAEYRTTVVRGLSSGLVSWARSGKAQSGKSKAPDPAPADLVERLRAGLGRELKKPEISFLRQVRQLYVRCCQSRQITPWDFQQLGMALPGQTWSWGAVQIWPAFPASEHEFWLYVAQAAQERGARWPQFMAPVTDLASIQEALRHWKREQEVEHWKRNLSLFEPETRSRPEAAPGEIDLRLAVEGTWLALRWRRAGQENFEPVKQTHFRQLESSSSYNQAGFTPEALLLWQIFTHGNYYGPKAQLSSSGAEVNRVLNRLLRLRLLDSLIVTAEGQPLARPAEPLRWELTPAASEQEDYRLRLVQADGSAPPPFLAALPGRPTLYLTSQAVFTGPELPEGLLDPKQETHIPAPAIERGAGVAFLQSLGLELPARLRERVRVLPYQVAITCALRPSFRGSDTEECLVTVMADAPDGQRRVWTGQTWAENTSRGARSRGEKGRDIILYDSASLAEIPVLLEPLNPKPAPYGGGLTVRVTKKFPETFVDWLKSIPPRITVQLLGDLASLTQADVAGRVRLDVTEAEIDWFDLRVVLNVEDATLTPAEIKLLLNAKGGYVRLKGKGWRRLQYDLNEEENERLARLGLNPRELSAEPQRLHALQLADEAARKFLPEEQVEAIQRRASELKARVAPDLPAGVTAQLRPYQLEGFHFLAYLSANRFGGILADDMGLGKTVQTLAWLLWLREQETSAAASPNGAPTLVVCPKSVMDNWHAEAARFTPGLRVRVWSASELDQFQGQLAAADLHVLNYSQLRMLGESLGAVPWLAVILDEGQYIKNPNSQTAQVARHLKTRHRLVLSGTPIENRLLDLWSLMAFAMPGILGSRAQFAKLYDAKGDPFARRRLSSRVRPFLVRRTKAQVAPDLPDRIEEDLFCEIEGEQKTLYRAELKRAQQLLLQIKTQKELAQQQFHFLTSLLRLRQVCCHPRLVAPQSKAASAKTEALLEQLEPLMEEGQKVLVFSQFVEMLDLLRPALEERNWPVFYLAGGTENRGELVRNFQAAEGPAIFLISLKAGGFGLNLTAASYVVLFDPWWNPAVEAQAIDRTHRIGQTSKVIAYRLLIKNSIEEKIRALQKQKKALAQDVLGEEKFAQSLTLDDLRFLFSD